MNLGIRVKSLEIPANKRDSQIYILKTSFPVQGYILVLFAAAALYILTCAPGVLWQDSGLIQYRVLHNDIEGKLGLALSHPLYYLIVIPFKYIKIDAFAYRINCANAIISAFAIANFFLLLRLWLGENYPALLGAATLALSHTFWLHSTMPETYGLVIALLLLELVMLLQYARTSKKKYLYLLAFINGLSIANHMMASIALTCYFVFVITLVVKKQLKVRHIFVMALLWMIGAIPYEYLIVKNIIATHDIAGTFASAMFGNKWESAVLNTSITLPLMKDNFLYLILNFPTPNILFIFVGVWYIYKVSPQKWFATIIITLTVLYYIFAFRYTVPDRYAFFIPFYCMLSIFIGIGVFSYLLESNGSHTVLFVIFCLVVVPVYIKAPEIAEGLDFKVGSGRRIPFRNDAEYFLHPWKMDVKDRMNSNDAEQFALQALISVESPAIIYADSTTAPPLLLVQELFNFSRKDDIKIISSIGTTEGAPQFNEHTIDELFSKRNIYVVSNIKGYCPDFLLDRERYKFKSERVLWKAEKKE
ncbi:MAG: DUF2723 domain-containing protein [Sedimentisphaerales bacterium]|nr:DUF2723 domain-containing protein [Sedimentisphaerales bacterium]